MGFFGRALGQYAGQWWGFSGEAPSGADTNYIILARRLGRGR